MSCHIPHVAKVGSRNRGFSLIELMVAMAIFLLVSASVFILFSQQQTSASLEQGVVGLNIGIRNAMSQLQLDLANAGSANYAGYSIPTWPVGVTIVNNVQQAGTSCYTPGTGTTPGTYGQNCFDQLNILEPDTTVPPISVTNATGGSANCPATYVSAGPAAAYGQAANGLPPINTIGYFHNGDQLLFLKSDGSKMTSVVLTQAPVVYNSVAIQFNFNPTNSDGSNTTGTNFNFGSNTVANDPLDIAACGGYPCPTTVPPPPPGPGPPRSQPQAAYLTDSFCGGDWIFRLAPIIYYVNTSNPNDPQLMRQQGTNNAVPVMDQVIGFKVGAAIWNSVNDNVTWGTSYYFYDASTYNINNPINPATGIANPPDSPYLFPFIRSVRVSLIGRTQPSTGPSFTFRNGFDGGHYMVQGASVIVSPRNLSMHD